MLTVYKTSCSGRPHNNTLLATNAIVTSLHNCQDEEKKAKNKEKEDERKRLQEQKDEEKIQAKYKATAQWTREKLVGIITELNSKLYTDDGQEAEFYKMQKQLTQIQMTSVYKELEVLDNSARDCLAGRINVLDFGRDEVNRVLGAAKALLRSL